MEVDRREVAHCTQLNLLRDAERIVNLDPETPDGTFELRVTKQQLSRSQLAYLLVDLGWLWSPRRVGAIGGAVKASAFDPSMDMRTYCRVET
jgi:hypothetical protein